MPLSDINPGSALTAVDSNDAPLFEFRVKRSGSITPLAIIKSLALDATQNESLQGKLAFLTNSGSELTAQLLIDSQGKLGIGTQDPQAKLHIAGNAKCEGQLSVQAALVDSSMEVKGSARIEGDVSLGGNIGVKGTVSATSFLGDGGGLGGITLSKVSDGKIVVKGERVGIGADLSEGDTILDVGSRMRVRQGSSLSAGIWFAQKGVDYSAFVGMADDSKVGFWGGGAGWGLTMNKDDGSVSLAGALTAGGKITAASLNVGGEIHVSGRSAVFGGTALRSTFGTRRSGSGGPIALRPTFHDLDINGTVHCNTITSESGKGFKIDHPLDPANKYLYHWCVESPDIMNIYNGNVVTDGDGRATVVLPEYFDALNGDFRYQLTVIGTPALAIVEREIESNAFTIKTDHPDVKVSWQVTGVRQDAAVLSNHLPVEEEKPKAEREFAQCPQRDGQTETKSARLEPRHIVYNSLAPPRDTEASEQRANLMDCP